MKAPYTIPAAGKATHILDTAERLFGSHGFEGVSMSTLAAEARVSKANIFHHFKSKEELYLTVLHRARKRFVTQLLSAANGQHQTQQQIQSLTRTYLKQILENEPLVRLLLRELMEKRHTGEILSERLFADNFAELVALMREAQSRGELNSRVDPGMVMMIIASVSLFYLQGRDFIRHLPGMAWTGEPGNVSDALWEILWHGIAPPASNVISDGNSP